MAVLPMGIGPVTGGYQIERSLRFNSADSAYLNRTFASAGNRSTWTWSAWVKRSFLDSTATSAAFQTMFHAGVYTTIAFSADSIYFQMANGAGSAWYIQTSQVFRDPSAWYHIVAVMNTTSATASQRMRLYVNGAEVTAFSTDQRSSITQNTTAGEINNNIAHALGSNTTPARYFPGYLTEINFIDGSAKTPSDFGETDSATGVWKPKAYSGTYGTNGFYLKFADNSGTTSTTLGKDSSGNSNNWTPNNFSVTAGAGNDSLVDSPTAYGTDTGVGGEVRGNYATWNPLDKDDGITSVTNGNLNVVTNGSNGSIKSTIAFPSGKWYWEVTSDTVNSGGTQAIGIIPQSQPPTNNMSDSGKLGYALDVSFSDRKFENGTSTSYGTYTQANGAIYMLAFDQTAGKLWYGINGTWLASGDPAAGTNASSSSISTSTAYCAAVSDNTVSGTFTANFGQRAFAYTAPSGFKALCTTNLPTPTIGATSTTQADDYFNTVLYTGTGSTRTVTGVGFQPDFTWIKPRSSLDHHILYDAIRGVRKQIYTNLTNAEETETQGLSAFTSDGFTVNGAHTVRGQTNDNTVTYVAWNWNAGGSNATNTAGTITSTVRANTTSGFSIVTYPGNDLSAATVGHGLGTTPSMIIVKARTFAAGWNVYHRSLPASNGLLLNATNSQFAASTTTGGIINTSPTSTTFGFTAGTSNVNNVNANGHTYVAYCFAEVAGYSAFGSYTGNGSTTDPPFVYLGFRPKWLLRKRSDTGGTSDWQLQDTAREPYNPDDTPLWPNLTNAQSPDPAFYVDFLSNGFKLRGTTASTNLNVSSATYIYVAFAENPFKYSLAR